MRNFLLLAVFCSTSLWADQIKIDRVEKMAKVPSDKQRELVLEYRQGKYNQLIEEELLEIIK